MGLLKPVFFFHEHTLAIGEDSHAVDVVCVTVVELYTFACRHQPPPDTGIVAAREELAVADDC